jgi:spore coat-associated protein N
MSRLSILIKRPKRTLAVLTTALAAVGVAVGSGADFTATSANPTNTFASGTLSIDNSKEGVAIFTPSNMRPGGPTQTGVVDIENSGSLAGTFSLSRTNLVDDATVPATLSSKINLVVKDCGLWSGTPAVAPTCDAGDPDKYTGTLAAFNTAAALGSYAAGDKHRYEFAATLDSSADDSYQGDNASARFQWDAVQ